VVDVGVEPSVVYRIVASLVVVLMETVWAVGYVPAVTEKVGVAVTKV
jgi:uncharacterized membrane protein YGL010W